MNSAHSILRIVILITALLFILAGFTSYAEMKIPSLVFGLILTLFYLTSIAGICSVKRTHLLYSILAVATTLAYALLICFNYFSQLGFIGRGLPIPEQLEMTNPDSIFWSIEVLGYFFMGLSTLFLIPLFRQSNLEKAIKFLFVVNGLLGLGGIMGFALNWSISILLGGLLVWNIIMPLAMILVYFQIKVDILGNRSD